MPSALRPVFTIQSRLSLLSYFAKLLLHHATKSSLMIQEFRLLLEGISAREAENHSKISSGFGNLIRVKVDAVYDIVYMEDYE